MPGWMVVDLVALPPRQGSWSVHSSNTSGLPHTLADGDELAGRLAGRRPAVFLYVLASTEEVERLLNGLARED